MILALMQMVHNGNDAFTVFADKVRNNNLLVCCQMTADFDQDEELLPFIAPCAENAYNAVLRAAHLEGAYLTLSIYQDTVERAIPIAALAGFWHPSPDNTMLTRYESVHTDFQRQGYGSLLFTAFELVMLCLARHDPFMGANLAGGTEVTLQVHVNLTDPDWHRDMMLRRGYVVVDVEDGASVFEKNIAF
jgi:hypothetical protein